MIQIDMKMPKDCYHCPCHKHWDVNNYICGITRDTANYIGYRQDFCPLKEVSNEPVLDKIRAELHATAEMHEDGDYYLRDEWIDEYFDKYKAESEEA